MASLRAGLTAGDRPALARLTTRADDDFTIALLDAAACMADIITFYNERLINEAYVRTAIDRSSVVELGKLVAYRARPGVAAATHLAFYVEPPPTVEVEQAAGPFRKIRMPAAITIPAGTAVRSVPGPGEQQQVFETSGVVEARPQWNLMKPVATRQPVLGRNVAFGKIAGQTQIFVSAPRDNTSLAAVANSLKRGDILLFTNEAGAVEFRSVETVEAEPKRERVRVAWRDGLTAAAPLTAHVVRKRLNVFGYNAPMWKAMSSEFKKNYPGGVWTFALVTKVSPDWPDFLITEVSTPGAMAIDLDGPHPDIVGKSVVLSAGSVHRKFTVTGLQELSRAEFSVSGKVTRLALSGSFSDWKTFFREKVRETTVTVIEEPLSLSGEPLPAASTVRGAEMVIAGDVSGLPPGRTLLVAALDPSGNPTGVVEVATVAAVTKQGDNTRVTLTDALKQVVRYKPSDIGIFGNVVAATHGETVHQILGDGDAATPFQRFELKHTPLTYVPSDEASGASSTLQVRVNDIAWHESPTLYGAGPREQEFVTAANPAGVFEVLGGDGVRGARLTTGQHNVRATYRKGLGVGGNLGPGALTQLGSPPLGVTGVTNPGPAAGGADPDPADYARQGVQISTRTLDRAVSLSDYADFARNYAGIAKSHVMVLSIAGVRTIVVTVAADNADEVSDAKRALLTAALRSHGDPLVPVVVVRHREIGFVVKARVRRHPDYQADKVRRAVADRLTDAFGFPMRELTQPIAASAVIATIQAVPGVVAVDLDRLSRQDQPGKSDNVRLRADAPGVTAQAVTGAELLVLAANPLDSLTEMT
ncbi:putative baseplate assembly protein [Mycobacterium sp. C3-094]